MITRKRPSLWRRLVLGLLAVLALALVGVGYLALVPPATGNLASHPQPVANYAEAVNRIAALQAQESATFNPQCTTQFLTHDQKAARAIAFVHGYTNCPVQFLQLGQQFYALGYNVLIVPLPHHGLADRLTDDLTNFTAEDMAAYSDQVVDIERGLGDRISIVGLSGGGVVTAWAAQTRTDLDQAVLIAPGFDVRPIPNAFEALVTNVVLLLPDSFQWWDPVGHDSNPTGPMSHAYPRFSVHGLAQQLRLGYAVRALARRSAPGASSILVITNASDLSVDNGVTAGVVADWRAHGAAHVTTYEYPQNLGLSHDLIDPAQSYQHVDIVYPKLIELINQ